MSAIASKKNPHMTEPATPFQGPGPEQVYHGALKEGRFLLQRCGACARHVFQPRVLCPHCGSTDLAWVAPSGRGVVHSTTTVRRSPEAGGDLNVALIDLEEGVRMMSRVEGIAPDDVRIGMAVRAHVAPLEPQPLVLFTPQEAQ